MPCVGIELELGFRLALFHKSELSSMKDCTRLTYDCSNMYQRRWEGKWATKKPSMDSYYINFYTKSNNCASKFTYA